MTCTDTSDCNDHGDCIDDNCSCDLGWFGTNCEESGQEEWGDSWEAFVVVFIIFYSVFLFLSIVKLYAIISPEVFLGIRRLSRRIISSPKNLSLCCLSLVSLIKILWLSIDPLLFEEKSSRIMDRLLFETVYPLYFCMYCSVLLVLGGLYQGIRYNKSALPRRLRKLLIFLIIAGFPVTWTLSTLKGIRVSQQWIYSVGYGLIGAAAAFLALAFIVLVTLLCSSITVQTHSHDQNLSPADSPRNYGKLEKGISREPSYVGIRPYEEDEKSILIITAEDKSILRKIIFLSALSSFLGISTVLMFTSLYSLDTRENTKQIIIGLYFGFSLELIGCFFIFMIFTTQIKVQSREILKEFSRIALKKKNCYSKIWIKDDNLRHISKRLEKYFPH